MIKKLLGISDKSIIRKSTYYGYFINAIFGFIAIFTAIGMFIFKYTDVYKKILIFQNGNIQYLQSISEKTNDVELLSASTQCLLNLSFINDIYMIFSILLFILGFVLILNFILFKELRNSKINKKK